MINEQLAESSFSRQGLHKIIELMDRKDKVVFITGVNGKIYFANSSVEGLEDFKEETLIGQKIDLFIENYCNIEELMLWEGSLTNVPVYFRWNGALLPGYLNVSLVMQSEKVEHVVYMISLKSKAES